MFPPYRAAGVAWAVFMAAAPHAAAAAAQEAAESYPSRPVRLIAPFVPFVPGGPTAAPDVKEKFAGLGMEVVANRAEEFAASIKSENVKWTKVMKTIGLKPESATA